MQLRCTGGRLVIQSPPYVRLAALIYLFILFIIYHLKTLSNLCKWRYSVNFDCWISLMIFPIIPKKQMVKLLGKECKLTSCVSPVRTVSRASPEVWRSSCASLVRIQSKHCNLSNSSTRNCSALKSDLRQLIKQSSLLIAILLGQMLLRPYKHCLWSLR